MKLILGLGNPGERYRATRHNLGAEAVQAAARQLGVRFQRHSCSADWGRGQRGPFDFMLAVPTTYMNLSGQAAAALARYYRVSPEDLLTVVDDLNLPLGQMRFRASGSAGGHNGLRSIIEQLGSDQFHRLRLGIGTPFSGQEVTDFVLTRFAPEEREPVQTLIQRASEAILTWLDSGLAKAMQTYN